MKDQRGFQFVQVILLLMVLAAVALAQQAQQRPSPTLDQLKSQNFKVLTIDGKRIELNKLIGQGKPVMLDFWATWCGPCRAEIPHLMQLAEKYRKQGLIVIGLNLEDPVDDQKLVSDFVKEFSMNYQSVFVSPLIYQFFNPNTRGYRIPQTYVFDREGTLVRGLIGYNNRTGKEILGAAIEKAISGNQIRK
jgi:thiol-disulfide isomerase/thioredoxin